MYTQYMYVALRSANLGSKSNYEFTNVNCTVYIGGYLPCVTLVDMCVCMCVYMG